MNPNTEKDSVELDACQILFKASSLRYPVDYSGVIGREARYNFGCRELEQTAMRRKDKASGGRAEIRVEVRGRKPEFLRMSNEVAAPREPEIAKGKSGIFEVILGCLP